MTGLGLGSGSDRDQWGDAGARALVERAKHLPVAPTAVARARVWSRVVDGGGRRKKISLRWPSAFAVGALAMAALALVVWRGRAPSAFSPGPSGAHEIAVGEPLVPSDAVPPGLTVVELPETARMVLVGQTVARLDRFTADEVELTVERGSVLMHVLPRGKRQPLVIHTPGFDAKVVGTVLRVEVSADGRASLAVGHGAVEVTPASADTRPILVRTGEHWPAAAVNVPRTGELELLGAAHCEGVTLKSFAPAPLALDTCGEGSAALSCLQARAAAEHDAVAAESDLYQAGWIAARRLGDPAGALTLWHEQALRFPRGVLGRERLASTVDALVALGRDREALGTIDELLRIAPMGVRAAEMHFVRGTLLAAADGDCRRATPELRLALRHAAPPWAERARQALDRCVHGRR